MRGLCFLLQLICYHLDSPLHCFRVAKVIVSNRSQIIMEFIYKGNSCRNVEPNDCVIRNMIEIFDESTQTIPVGCDEHAFAFPDSRGNCLMPIRKKAGKGYF